MVWTFIKDADFTLISYVVLAILVWYSRDIYNFFASVKTMKNSWSDVLEMLKNLDIRTKDLDIRLNDLDIRLNDLDMRLNKVADDVVDLRNHLTNLTGIVANLVVKVDGLTSSVVRLTDSRDPQDSQDSLAQSNSPQCLTAKGEKVARQIDADLIVEKYRKHLDLAEDMGAYDIQDACYRFAADILPKEYLTDAEKANIKEVAFQLGDTEWTVLRTVIGLTLRDAIFKERDIPLRKGQYESDNEGESAKATT